MGQKLTATPTSGLARPVRDRGLAQSSAAQSNLIFSFYLAQKSWWENELGNKAECVLLDSHDQRMM